MNMFMQSIAYDKFIINKRAHISMDTVQHGSYAKMRTYIGIRASRDCEVVLLALCRLHDTFDDKYRNHDRHGPCAGGARGWYRQPRHDGGQGAITLQPVDATACFGPISGRCAADGRILAEIPRLNLVKLGLKA
jgi:hypothetical protein